MELEKACALHCTVLYCIILYCMYCIGLKDSVLLRYDSPKPCLKKSICVCVCVCAVQMKQAMFLIDLRIKSICSGNGQILDHVNMPFSIFEEEAEKLEKNTCAYCWKSTSTGV